LGYFNSWSGTFRLRRGEDVDAAVAELEELLDRDVELIASEVPGAEEDEYVVSGGCDASAQYVGDVDSAILAMAPFATAPGGVLSECDEGSEWLYVGPPEGEAGWRSARLLEEIEALDLDDLAAEDARKLILRLAARLSADELERLHDDLARAPSPE